MPTSRASAMLKNGLEWTNILEGGLEQSVPCAINNLDKEQGRYRGVSMRAPHRGSGGRRDMGGWGRHLASGPGPTWRARGVNHAACSSLEPPLRLPEHSCPVCTRLIRPLGPRVSWPTERPDRRSLEIGGGGCWIRTSINLEHDNFKY